MNVNAVSRFYDRLGLSERIRLLLDAAAREDSAELSRLWSTTPRDTYTMANVAVLEAWEASERCALTWALVWTDQERRYEIISTALFVGAERLPEGLDRQEVGRAHGRRAAELAGTFEGLERFCRRVELEPEAMIKAWVPHVWEGVSERRGLLDFYRGMHDNQAVPGCCVLGWCQTVELWATVAEAGLCRRWPDLHDVAEELLAKRDDLVARLDAGALSSESLAGRPSKPRRRKPAREKQRRATT